MFFYCGIVSVSLILILLFHLLFCLLMYGTGFYYVLIYSWTDFVYL